MYACEPIKNVHVLVYVLYCWTNGEHDNEAAGMTNELINLVLQDSNLQHDGPKLITTDLNCTIERLPALQFAIDNEGWCDVGGKASAFKGINELHTCKATPHARETRRDFVFANPKATPLIDFFKVDDDANLHTHKIITLGFKQVKPCYEYDSVKLPERIFKIFQDKCLKIYGEQNIELHQRKREVANDNSKQFKVEIAEVKLGVRMRKKTKRQPIIDYVKQVSSKENLSEQLQSNDAYNFTKKQLDVQKAKLHSLIDYNINTILDARIFFIKKGETI